MGMEEFDSDLVITLDDHLILYKPNLGKDQIVKVPAPSVPPNLTPGQLEILNKEKRIINSLAVSTDGQHIVISTENKQVVVYNKDLNVIRNFITNRTASKVIFTKTNDIIVADRTGDVYLYKLSSDNDPILLLGHLSMILDVVISDCGKYIITCDRDEKIRVSYFPNTYNIVSYCLGHEEFVITIKIVGDILVSASGDGTIRIWNYLKGQELNKINTNHYLNKTDLIEKFSKEMDAEKVDVSALPITEMKIYKNNIAFVAVALYHYDGVQLYKLETKTCTIIYLKTINTVEEPQTFCLSNKLFMFNHLKFVCLTVDGEDYIETKCSQLTDFHRKYQNLFKTSPSNTVTVLYKRKFDNVQEYLERKKLRMESK